MSFFGKKGKTAEQKAQWAKTRLMLRGAALVYLVVFIVIPLMNPETEDIDAMNPTTRYIIVAFFIIACGTLLFVTVKDYFQGKKAGLFSPEAYEDDKIAEDNEEDDYEEDDLEEELEEDYEDDHDENE